MAERRRFKKCSACSSETENLNLKKCENCGGEKFMLPTWLSAELREQRMREQEESLNQTEAYRQKPVEQPVERKVEQPAYNNRPEPVERYRQKPVEQPAYNNSDDEAENTYNFNRPAEEPAKAVVVDNTVSVVGWILTFIMLALPGINIIYVIVSLVSKKTSKTKKNYLIAVLVMGMLSIGIALIAATMFSSLFNQLMYSTF